MTHTVLATDLEFPEGPVWLGPRRVAFTQIRGQCLSLWDESRRRLVSFREMRKNVAAERADLARAADADRNWSLD